MISDQEKRTIRKLRDQNYGYGTIAKMLRLSEGTVKGVCRRGGMQGTRGKTADQAGPSHCLMCGAPIRQVPGRKIRKFCSHDCCQKWWNEHPDRVDRQSKSFYTFTCKYCGKKFTAYGNSKRKYCSHECYIADRFGE